MFANIRQLFFLNVKIFRSAKFCEYFFIGFVIFSGLRFFYSTGIVYFLETAALFGMYVILTQEKKNANFYRYFALNSFFSRVEISIVFDIIIESIVPIIISSLVDIIGMHGSFSSILEYMLHIISIIIVAKICVLSHNKLEKVLFLCSILEIDTLFSDNVVLGPTNEILTIVFGIVSLRAAIKKHLLDT